MAAPQKVKTFYKTPERTASVLRLDSRKDFVEVPERHANRVELNQRKRDEQTPLAQKIGNRASGIIRGGLQNFADNYHKKPEDSLGDTLKRGLSNFGENVRAQRSAPSRGRSASGGGGFAGGFETGLNLDTSYLVGGGIDMSLHPDPMYHQQARRPRREHEGGKRRVVRTVTYYDDEE